MMYLEVLISIDQVVNTLCGGYADETISARAWRLKDKNSGWAAMRILIDTLFFFQFKHCYNAYLSEMDRKQEPAEYRR